MQPACVRSERTTSVKITSDALISLTFDWPTTVVRDRSHAGPNGAPESSDTIAWRPVVIPSRYASGSCGSGPSVGSGEPSPESTTNWLPTALTTMLGNTAPPATPRNPACKELAIVASNLSAGFATVTFHTCWSRVAVTARSPAVRSGTTASGSPTSAVVWVAEA